MMKPICKKLHFCTFGDLLKIMYGTPIRKMKYAVCIAIHPQTIIQVQIQDRNAILGSLGIQVDKDRPFLNQKKYVEAVKSIVHGEIGRFYRLWLYHFDKSFSEVWRDGKACVVKAADMPKNAETYEDKVFYDTAKRVTVQNCAFFHNVDVLGKCYKKQCPVDKVCNPKSGRCKNQK